MQRDGSGVTSDVSHAGAMSWPQETGSGVSHSEVIAPQVVLEAPIGEITDSGDLNATWPAIFLVVAFGVVATAVVPQLVPIVRDVARTYPASVGYAGWLISLPSAICAIGALAAGLLVDRIGDRRMVLGGALCVALGDFGAFLSASIAGLAVWRLVEGAGYLALAVGGATMLMRMTQGRRRRTALALWSAHTPIGFGLALALVTPLAGRGELWRWSFAGHGVLVCALAAFGWVALHPRDLSGYRRGEGSRKVLRTPAAYRLGFASLCCALLTGGFLAALPGGLATRFGLSAGHAAGVAIIDLTFNALAALAMAAALRRGLSTHRAMIGCVIASSAAWVVYFGVSNLSIAAVASAILLIAIGALNAVIWGMLPAVTPDASASGATSGLVTQATYIGVLLGPPAIFAAVAASTATPLLLIGPGVCLLLSFALPSRGSRDDVGR